MKHTLQLSIVSIACLILGRTLLGAEPPVSTVAPGEAGAARSRVRTVNPSPVTGGRAYSIPGRTEPDEHAMVFTRATGIVSERRFDIGDRVKAGDVLATIDAPEVDRAVESARAVVDRALARSENARALYERAQRLAGSRAISQEDVDQRQADLAEAGADVRYAQAELARLQEQQRFCKVVAPFTGRIAGRNFDRGDRVKGDSADASGWLYRLVRIDLLRFVVAAPPDLALRLHPGDRAAIRFGEFPGREIEGRLTRSSGVIDETSGTMRIELVIANDDLSIPAGLTGFASFELGARPDVYLLPNNTTVTEAGAARVATVEDGKVRMVPVVLGRNLGGRTEVQSRVLSEKSLVIMNPNALLREGDEVVIASTDDKK